VQRPTRLPDAGQAAALGFLLVGLDPDRSVDKVSAFATGRPDALDDQQRTASCDLYRSRPLELRPSTASTTGR